jgi:acyl carrier protein
VGLHHPALAGDHRELVSFPTEPLVARPGGRDKEIQMDRCLEKIIDVLVSRFGVPASEVSAEVSFTDLELDSLALVEFVLVMEQNFGVSIAEDEVSPDNSLIAIARLIDSKRTLV